MGRVYNQLVNTLPFQLGYNNFNINHLEMINIMWPLKYGGICGLIKNCDNLPVVEVLKPGRGRDNTLAACARNIWLLTSIYNILLHVIHIQASRNSTAHLLSRWQGTTANIDKQNALLPNHVWLNTQNYLMLFNNEI